MVYVSAGENREYELHPDGMYPAVCCDVVDAGMPPPSAEHPEWIQRPQVKLVFQTPLDREDGYPFTLRRYMTASLHEKATLRGFLESWLGRKITEAEAKRFNLEDMIGRQGNIQVMHVRRGDNTYANINNIVPAMKGQQPIEIRDYVREIDRQGSNGAAYSDEGSVHHYVQSGPIETAAEPPIGPERAAKLTQALKSLGATVEERDTALSLTALGDVGYSQMTERQGALLLDTLRQLVEDRKDEQAGLPF